jgi:hypothetical protein
MILPAAVALIAAADPAGPATYRPLVAHCAAAYAEGCCPLCGGPLTLPPALVAELTAAGVLERVTVAGACAACDFLFMGPDPRDPADMTAAELTRVKMQWLLAAVAVLGGPPEGDPPC